MKGHGSVNTLSMVIYTNGFDHLEALPQHMDGLHLSNQWLAAKNMIYDDPKFSFFLNFHCWYCAVNPFKRKMGLEAYFTVSYKTLDFVFSN